MNNWLKQYGGRIEKVNYILEESIQRGSFDTTLDLKEIQNLFRGLTNEIKNLQKEIDQLKKTGE